MSDQDIHGSTAVNPDSLASANTLGQSTSSGDFEENQANRSALQYHDRIITAASHAATRLLRSNSIENNVLELLSLLGNAIDVSYCVLFEILHAEPNPTVRINSCWQKPGAPDFAVGLALEPYLPHIESTHDGIFLETSALINSLTNQLPFSLAIMRLDHGNQYWGYLALIDNEKYQTWPTSTREAIRSSTNLISAIFERHRLEQHFRENETRNRVIIDSLPDLVIRIDTSGKILDYTARKDHPLFINREEITGKMLSDIWPKGIVKRIIQGEKTKRFQKSYALEEFKLPFSNKVYESRLDPIGPHEALVVIRDVTEQAELRQMKSDFINRASHELRTPVTSAILMTELIQGGGLPQEIEEYWNILTSELNRQKILIDRLLIAGRLESGMMHLEISPIDLGTILQDSLAAVKPLARKKKISIDLNVPPAMPKILGDKSGLQQVFINLINNAIKFSPDGSVVTLTAEHIGSEIRVSISDQGMGIPAKDVPHLFERFYRAREVTIAEIPGSGVGLFIVKSILEGLGGKIELTSSSPAGTTFTTTLRCSEGMD